MNEPEIMNVDELADYLFVHNQTIYRLVRKGKIPYLKVGGDYRFRRDEILKMVQRVEPAR